MHAEISNNYTFNIFCILLKHFFSFVNIPAFFYFVLPARSLFINSFQCNLSISRTMATVAQSAVNADAKKVQVFFIFMCYSYVGPNEFYVF